MRVKPFHRKVMLGVAVLAAAGLGAGLTAGLASAAGPYVAQGAVVDLCIGTSGTALDHVYAEAGRDAGKIGSCDAGYVQLPVVSAAVAVRL